MISIKPNPDRRHESYIGEGAYVFLSKGSNVVLYTAEGTRETNRVVLEYDVLKKFSRWVKDVTPQLESEWK